MTIPPTEPGFLAPWISRQRWYANKGAHPVLEQIGSWSLESDREDIELVTHLFLDLTPGKPALYQVPVSYRSSPDGPAAAFIGEHEGRHLYDGPHDPEFTASLLRFMTEQREASGDRAWAIGHSSTTASTTSGLTRSRVLTGEQSNTSIVFEGEGTPVICKLFRALHHGDNPDVVLQTALAAAGSDAVPAAVGSIVADWTDSGEPDGRARGHLAFAQEFLPGARDAWSVALEAAGHGEDFSERAHALGIEVAGVHATLALALPSSPTTPDDAATVIDLMHGRLASAIMEVPQLEQFADAAREIFARAASVAWPAQQRIHGDLHLGQVLAVPGRSWVIVDFEGEPLRPMRERNRLDSPVRDVAGMLRSFDYVAGSLEIAGRDAGAAEWVAAARVAFERGYSEASGRDIRENRVLIDAFELDKALYETVYEARNRPDWLSIPVNAIARLSSRPAEA